MIIVTIDHRSYNHSGIIHRSSWVIIVTIDHNVSLIFSHGFSQRFAGQPLRKRLGRCPGAFRYRLRWRDGTESWVGLRLGHRAVHRTPGWVKGWRAWGQLQKPLGDRWFSNIAMENGELIVDFPIKHGDFHWDTQPGEHTKSNGKWP